ncbi:tyrosine-type recombinase/integrase [Lederbergia galactosidilytica]|uniref:Integrase n=1 Tax=Lederbergia galactosidilytica TaxID=217031 RepID=A0A177ZXK0_9BACI|nr:tyrosine-type recombinase/integrase [Lederbergia galactosidilytica]OAK72655.1 integrase [Lederbergia galactosidilytica]
MATFQKRGKTWQYTISRYTNGKYDPIRKGGFRTKGEAKVVADDIEYKLSKGLRIHNEPIPLAKHFEDWFTLYKTDLTTQTLNHYKDTLRYIEEYFADKAIQNITRNDYQEFLNVYGEKYSKEVMLKVNGHIKAAAEHAMEDEIIRINFANRVKVTGKPAKNKKEKHLEFDESELLYDALFERLKSGLSYYAVLLLLVSGIRFEELVGLTRNDFDFDNNSINVEKTWGYKKSMPKGFGPTKNDQSERIIGIDPKVMKEFKKLFMQMPDNIQRLVFFSPSSKYKCLSNNAVNKSLKKTLDDLNIKNIITAHGLRHTHASALIYKKASIIYVSERLGHSSPDITYRRYAHVMKELRIEDEAIAVNIY